MPFSPKTTVILGLAVLTAALGGCELTTEAPAPPPPRDPIVAGPTDEQLLRVDEASAMKAGGDYDQALALFQQILGDNPTIVPAYLGVGDIYVVKQDYARAEPAYGRAARLEPRNFDAQYGHGLSLQMLGRFRDAIQAYQRALTIRPDDSRTNLNVATSYLQLQEADRAITFAEQAVRNDPENGAAWANLGATYEKVGRDRDAIDAYLSALELMGNHPPLMANLVNALARQQRYREAANTAQSLARIEPSANVYERLGWSHFKLREFDQSLVAYQTAVELDPNHWPSHNGIGVNALNRWLISERRDNEAHSMARSAFRRSLSLNPNQDRVVELMLKYRF